MIKNKNKNTAPKKNDEFKVKNPKATFKRILSYLLPFKAKLVVAFLCLLINVGANTIGTFMLSKMIDDYIVPLAQGSNAVTIADFAVFVLLMAIVYLVGALLHYAFNYILTKITTEIQRDIRDRMFERMQRLPVQFYAEHSHGDLMSRYTNDTDTLRELMSSSLPNIISNGLTLIAIFVMMIILSPLLTLFIVVMLVIMLVIMKFVAGKSGKHFMRQQVEVGALDGYVEEHIDGMKEVKAFCHENAEKEGFDNHNVKWRYTSRKANTYANVLMPIMGNISYINYAVTAIGGTIMAISGFGGMTLGKLVAFLQYSRQFGNPIAQMAQQINSILLGLAGAERIFELIDAKSEEDEGYVTLVNAVEDNDGNIKECDEYTGVWAWKHYHKASDTTTYVKWKGAVEFENVSFSYDNINNVLSDINLEAKPGQKVALVGSTGAGKTTITNLINRFYDIDKGKIRFDKINIKKIKKEDLRQSMAMVLQDTHLFSGTVMENIRFGKLDATDEEVVSAAKLANADYFISHLPNGYDTVLSGDGNNLSQGQRQLLSIARAAVANPPVLVLDEATSSIDTRTEKLIEQGMDKLMQGRTVFVIAHRLSTVRNADVILVIEHGKIIESGNHEKLLKLKGKYYQLYTGAFELD